MPAYIIARVRITDREQYRKYLEAAPEIILQYGGKVIARTEEPVTLEGPEEDRRIVVIEFPSAAQAAAWYRSPEYGTARELRRNAGAGELIVVEGFVPG